MGQPLKMLQCLYSGITSAVGVNSYTTKLFKVTQSLRQGCVLSPTLFNLFINELPANLKIPTEGVKLDNMSFHSLLYADDLAILAGNITDLQKA